MCHSLYARIEETSRTAEGVHVDNVVGAETSRSGCVHDINRVASMRLQSVSCSAEISGLSGEGERAQSRYN